MEDQHPGGASGSESPDSSGGSGGAGDDSFDFRAVLERNKARLKRLEALEQEASVHGASSPTRPAWAGGAAPTAVPPSSARVPPGAHSSRVPFTSARHHHPVHVHVPQLPGGRYAGVGHGASWDEGPSFAASDRAGGGALEEGDEEEDEEEGTWGGDSDGYAAYLHKQGGGVDSGMVGRPSPGSAVKVVPRDGRPGYTLSQASGAGGHGELPSVEDDARSLRGDSRWLGRVVV